MKTNLIGKSNAILTELGYGFIAIIGCSGGENKNIDKKLLQAITDHNVFPKGTVVTLTQNRNKTQLTAQQPITFFAEWVEDGEDVIRDYELKIVTTY